MKDIMGLMKQAKKMQENMEAAKEKVADITVIGQAGGGLAKVTLSGGGNMSALELDPSIIDPEDPDMLTDLVIAAYQDAKVKLDEQSASTMKEAMGGLQLPPGMGF